MDRIFGDFRLASKARALNPDFEADFPHSGRKNRNSTASHSFPSSLARESASRAPPRPRVELALPLLNDSLYEKDIVVPGETWMEKVQRKLQFAVPDRGEWGETMDNYEVFVKGGPGVKTVQFKVPRGMLEYVVGMGGKVVEEISNDTNTRIVLQKPALGAKTCVFAVTGKAEDVNAAQYIFQQIVKSNVHKLNMVRPITNS